MKSLAFSDSHRHEGVRIDLDDGIAARRGSDEATPHLGFEPLARHIDFNRSDLRGRQNLVDDLLRDRLPDRRLQKQTRLRRASGIEYRNRQPIGDLDENRSGFQVDPVVAERSFNGRGMVEIE